MTSPPISLEAHLLHQSSLGFEKPHELFHCLNHVGLVGKLIAKDLRQAGLGQWMGSTGTTNVQGEDVQRLDQRANDLFLQVFQQQRVVSVVVSEELEGPHIIRDAEKKGCYALFIDPLDGSSNIDVNAPLGSIFSIYKVTTPGVTPTESALKKKGREQLAAGYILYGSSVILVYTAGNGVFQFTLDQEVGEFFLSGSKIVMPSRGQIYSANEGNCRKWKKEAQQFLAYLQESDTQTGRPYSGRYSGCLVADVHRILLKGGLYLYPEEEKRPEGKLRLMYEAAPLSFIIEQAGGFGSTGRHHILDLVPTALHQRVPLWIGSRDDVMLAESYHGSTSQT